MTALRHVSALMVLVALTWILPASGLAGDGLDAKAISAGLKDKDYNVRAAAVEELGLLGTAEVVPHLEAALSDEIEDVRWKAFSALERVDSKLAAKILVKLLRSKNAEVRKNAMTALAANPDPTAIQAIINVLGDKEPDVRKYAAIALTDLDAKQAADAVKANIDDTDMLVRRFSQRAALKLESKGAGAVAAKFFPSENDEQNRIVLAGLMARDGDKSQMPLIKQALSSEDFSMRVTGIEVLEALADKETLPWLEEAVKHESVDSSVAAAKALYKLKGRSELPRLTSWLQDPKDEVRRLAAAVALGEAGVVEAVPGLIKAMEDSDKYVRVQAYKALWKVGTGKEAVVKAFLTKLEPGAANPDLRWTLDSLAVLGTKDALPALKKVARGKDREAALAALRAIGWIEARK